MLPLVWYSLFVSLCIAIVFLCFFVDNKFIYSVFQYLLIGLFFVFRGAKKDNPKWFMVR